LCWSPSPSARRFLLLRGRDERLYYNDQFRHRAVSGVIGFRRHHRRPGSIYGSILGGFLFAGLQVVGTVLLPFASAYKDVFAFAVVIAIMAWRPTGLIQEKISERV
jgi:branched-chain amino acid transport system permease protein